jgi:hypothetical protein
MRKTIANGSLFVLAVLAVACSGNLNFTPPTSSSSTTTNGGNLGSNTPREALFEKDIGVVEDIVSTLSSIKDQASMNTARPKLNTLLQKHKEIKQDADKLGVPSAQEKDAMKRKFGDRYTKAKNSLISEMNRVLQLGGGDIYKQMAELNQDF